MTQRLIVVVLSVVLPAAAGCRQFSKTPNLPEIYNRAAEAKHPIRHPVIVIPGILGSRLKDPATDRLVWGAFAGRFANPQTADGARLVALPMATGAGLAALRDEVLPDGVLDRLEVSLLGLPIELNAYIHILRTLGVGGYRDEELANAGVVDYGSLHFTCFQFPYDWRRDNVENAKRLHEYILEKRAYVQREIKRQYGTDASDLRFDIVAHSMGGLVARYYLRYGAADLPADGSAPPVTWAGAEHVERVILVGTPNAGSLKALLQLTRGADFGPGLPQYAPGLLGTMPSIYQLLTRARHGCVLQNGEGGAPIQDLYDPELWLRMQWGLADPAQDRTLRTLLGDVATAAERRKVAVDHLRKCLQRASRFAGALDAPADPPDHVELTLVAGDAVSTDAVAAVEPDGRVRVIGRGPGDGTVLRSSALMDERVDDAWSPSLRSPIAWDHVHFLFTDHLGMTRDPAFTDNVLFRLLEAPRRSHGGT